MSENQTVNKNRRNLSIGILILIAVLAFAAFRFFSGGTEASGELIEDNRFLLDTVVSLRLYDSHGEDALEEAFELMSKAEGRLSRHLPDSEISLVNKSTPGEFVEVSRNTLNLILLSLDYANKSDGAFDPTIGPLVDLWDIGGDSQNVPDEGAIASALSLVNYKGITIDRASSTVALSQVEMSIDLGGIAKGWIADEAVSYLQENGERHILANLGGNVMVAGGKPDGSPFRIGMQNPFDDRGSYLGVFSITDGSVVSSGIYERYFEFEGQRYHHILDSSGGYPVRNGLAAVTVISRRSVDGDALSTTLFSLGLEQGLELVYSLEDIEAAFITIDGKIIMTRGAAEIFESTNADTEIEIRSGG